LKIFLDSMVGGAWPFLVGGVICLVNSVNERDLDLLNSWANPFGLVRSWAQPSCTVRALFATNFLEGLSVLSRWKFEAITGQ